MVTITPDLGEVLLLQYLLRLLAPMGDKILKNPQKNYSGGIIAITPRA
jgi:hypothetical protein